MSSKSSVSPYKPSSRSGPSQGEHLEAPLECVFSNGTLSLAVRAAVTGAQNATCKAPAWPLSRSGAHAANHTLQCWTQH